MGKQIYKESFRQSLVFFLYRSKFAEQFLSTFVLSHTNNVSLATLCLKNKVKKKTQKNKEVKIKVNHVNCL